MEDHGDCIKSRAFSLQWWDLIHADDDHDDDDDDSVSCHLQDRANLPGT